MTRRMGHVIVASMEETLLHLKQIVEADSVWSWAVMAVAAVLAALVIKAIFQFIGGVLHHYAARTKTTWDDVTADIIQDVRIPVLCVWCFYLFTKALAQTDLLHKILLTATVVATVVQGAIWGLHLIHTWRQDFLAKKVRENPSAGPALGLLYRAIQVAFLATLLLVGLDNLGVNVTALVAGLGVGGIAVALAAQNVLGDLLASLSIVLDKPFVVGDFIISGDELGTVENIGIKTTRVRSLSGEELVFSNRDLLESRVRNYKTLQQRRIVQAFGLSYTTPAEQLEQVPGWVRGFVEAREGLRFDRCHFSGYGESALNFELVFYVLSGDYGVYMDLQQQVFLDMYRKFAAENIQFAAPRRLILK